MPALRRRLGIALALGFALLAALGGFLLTVRAQEDWKKRDQWQRPAEVMEELGIQPGSVVADVGAGRGYFTFRLAERLGPQGKVYAEDIDAERLTEIEKRARKEGLSQVDTVHGTARDPRLPVASLDAILVVNSYHEMREYDTMLQGMHRALKPGGRLGVIDKEDSPGKSRKSYQERHTISEELVREDALRNGFQFLRKAQGFINEDGESWFFLVFDKPGT